MCVCVLCSPRLLLKQYVKGLMHAIVIALTGHGFHFFPYSDDHEESAIVNAFVRTHHPTQVAHSAVGDMGDSSTLMKDYNHKVSVCVFVLYVSFEHHCDIV